VNSSPIVHAEVVYIGASDGRVHAFALADGSPLGLYDLGVPIASSPMISGDTLYIGGYDGNLYAFGIRG
jgi:outer membrane protein assembly factor BamB